VAEVIGEAGKQTTIQDPAPAEHQDVAAACVVGYLAERDEITELWVKGDAGEHAEVLLEKAVEAAAASGSVLVDAVMEAAKSKLPDAAKVKSGRSGDIEMVG
jgi:exosome complex component MTR3